MMSNIFIFLFLCNSIKTGDLSTYKSLGKIFIQCVDKSDVVKCFKIQVLKIANTALKLKNISLWDGVSFVNDDRQSRVIAYGLNLNDTKLQTLESDELDDLLSQTSSK